MRLAQMTPEMENVKQFLETTIEAWPGGKMRYREDWDADYYSVADKCFALFGIHHEWGPQLIIKGEPAHNEELRELYDFVVPGYHMNKTHWNSIILTKSHFSEAELAGLLKASYDLIVSKLPKKTREALK